MNLKGKDFLKLLDFTSEEIGELVDFASELKAKKRPVFRIGFAKEKILH